MKALLPWTDLAARPLLALMFVVAARGADALSLDRLFFHTNQE